MQVLDLSLPFPPLPSPSLSLFIISLYHLSLSEEITWDILSRMQTANTIHWIKLDIFFVFGLRMDFGLGSRVW